MKKIIVVLLILVAVGSYYGVELIEKFAQPVNPSSKATLLVEIPSGSSTKSIGKILKNYELIHNGFYFENTVKTLGYDGQLKAGKYELSQSFSLEKIITKLYNGDVYRETVKFTIPEGYELREIIDLLIEKELVTNRETFMKELASIFKTYGLFQTLEVETYEGYLFPDTYIVNKDASNNEIITKMLDRFVEVYDSSMREQMKSSEMDLNQVITLASIIEREAALEEEREIVSSIFHNRIERDMKLQSCATVQYILEERKPNLTYDDIEIDDPYNTYIYAGLPPAPIASPGRESIEAALNPADTDYFYMVVSSKGDGSHVFSKTLKEHNRAKNKLKEGE